MKKISWISEAEPLIEMLTENIMLQETGLP